MSDIFNPIKGLPIVQSLSLPSIDYYTGAYSAIRYVKATTDQGDIDLYNRTTLGLKVTPSCFDKAGDYDVILSYRDGVRPEVTSTAHITVQLEVPVKLEVLKTPRATSFREGEHPNLAGAKFKVTYNSGRVEELCEHEVIGSLSDGSLTYTYRSMGAEVTATSAIEVVKLSRIEATTTKLTYSANEVIKAEDFNVTAIYTDGSKEVVKDFDLNLKTAEVGTTKIKIAYKGKSVEVAISVIAKVESVENFEALFEKTEETVSDGSTYTVYKLKGTIELDNDLDLPGSRLDVIAEPVTIDLKGHKLSTQLVDIHKNIEIKNGVIELKDTKRGLLREKENTGVSKITLTGVELRSAIESKSASLVQAEKATLYIKDCKMISTCSNPGNKYLFTQWQDGAEAYVENVETNTAIGTNGLIKDLHITLKNNKVTGGVYLPSSGEYIIDGGTYTSPAQSALEVKAGKVTIKAGIFKGSGNYIHVPYDNGNSTYGYDIAVVSNKAYKGGSVTVENGVVGRVSEFKDSADVAKLVTVKDLRAAATTTAIKVKTSPNKAIYKSGDRFDPTGMVLKAIMSDGKTQSLPITDSRLSYTDPGVLQLSKVITIRYTDDYATCSCDYTITVEGSNATKSESVRVWEDEAIELGTTETSAQVTIPAGTIVGNTAQLAVATQNPAADKPTMVVEDYNSVGAIDLTLEVDGKQVSEFSKPIDVTVATVKGLEGVSNFKVRHNNEDVTIKNYDPSTGKLTFETSHFSLFIIGVNSAVINTTTNTGYNDLKAALAVVDNGHTLKLYKNAITTEGNYKIESGKQFKIDMNSCDIVAPSTPVNLRRGNVEIAGKGVIRETEPDQFGAVYILGSFEEKVENYSTIKIGKDVTLRGWSGIMIDGSNKNRPNYKGYGIVVESDATIKCPIDGDTISAGTGIYVNGTNKLDIADAPKLTIRGSITVDGVETPSDTGCGIYAAGASDWVLDNVDINSTSCAVEIRAGKMIVKGGTYSASTEGYKVSPNNSGTTTIGAAFAVAQHTTKLPIEVTINDAKLKGTVGLSVANPQKNSAEDCAKVSVIGKNVAYEATENTKISEDFALTGTDNTFEIKASANTSEA